jgi:hypothetical protein
MTELVLRNQGILAHLEHVKSTIVKNQHVFNDSNASYSPSDAITDGEKYLSLDYLKKHMSNPEGANHPMEHYSNPVEHAHIENPDNKELENIFKFSRVELIQELGANDNAVFLYYPKGGFVGWHTNEANSGYQFIFSWSEKGDGYFQYYDKKTQKVVRIEDKAGWQARYYHFGKDEPDHCWHSAYTNVPRITICVLFRWWDKPHLKDQILAMKDQLIEEIESEI